MTRLMLERSYEAVIDAGINPRLLKGSRTAVFIGSCFSESDKALFYDKMEVSKNKSIYVVALFITKIVGS